MTQNPLISVIVPCYNNEKTVEETLSSIEKQTYSPIEIIIVDDCSNDNSIATISSLLSNSASNIKLLKNEINSGPSSTRNKGAKEANGKYLLFIDADDKIESTYIEKAISILEKNKNINIVYSEAEFFEAKKGKWELPDFKLEDFLTSNCIPIYCVIRKESFETVEGFDEKIRISEDWELWIKMIKKYGSNCIYKIPEVLFYYRKRKDKSSLIDNKDKKSEAEFCTLHIYNKHYDFFSKNELDILTLLASKNANEYYKKKYYNQWFKKIFYKFKK